MVMVVHVTLGLKEGAESELKAALGLVHKDDGSHEKLTHRSLLTRTMMPEGTLNSNASALTLMLTGLLALLELSPVSGHTAGWEVEVNL